MVARDPQLSRAFGEIAAENVAMFLQVIEDLLPGTPTPSIE